MTYTTTELGLQLPVPGSGEKWSTAVYNANQQKLEDAILALTRPSGGSLLNPTVLFSNKPAQWGAVNAGQTTVTTFTFTADADRPVYVKYGSIIDPGGVNIGGAWFIRLNGTQLGVDEGIGTPGSSAKAPFFQSLLKPGRLQKGSNTIELVVNREPGSNTIYGNRNSIEVIG